MPNISVQFRRGTDTEHSSFTGAVGEVTVDTTNDTLRVHDGSTAGGIRLAKLSEAGGSGTVTSVDSGTGLTGGPITTSGTLSLASINNLNVLGNVSGSAAAPTSVEIKDEDAMTSNSATALATQQSIKAYVDAQVGSSVSKYASSWFNDTTGLANGGTYSFTHGLGTTEVLVDIWMATSSAGANPVKVDAQIRLDAASLEYGGLVQDITTSALTVQLGASGWLNWDTSGQHTAGNWGTTYTHIKVVAIG
jgi:hypothetical protein